jgi:hypothetical protein
VPVAAILAPVLVQVALTFGLLLWMGSLRIRALRERQLHIRDIALGEPNWPKHITQVQNAYQNQFELPLLFYMLVALALVTGHVTTVLLVLAWLFVISRLVHALIHTTSNNVPRRFWAYSLGMTVLIVMWVWFLVLVVFG